MVVYPLMKNLNVTKGVCVWIKLSLPPFYLGFGRSLPYFNSIGKSDDHKV